jgi:hypothetical protein
VTSDRLLDRELLRHAFDVLARMPARRGVVGELHVFGGAAMVLAFDERAATRDVDALFQPDGPVLQAAREGPGGRRRVEAAELVVEQPSWQLRLRSRRSAGPRSTTTQIVERFFLGEPLSERSQQLLEDLLDEERP